MKNNLFLKIFLLIGFCQNLLMLADVPPLPPGQGEGEGTDGFGSTDDTPIDMFIVPLIILAIILIFHFAKKRSAKAV